MSKAIREAEQRREWRQEHANAPHSVSTPASESSGNTLPAGGSSGQVLKKSSEDNYAAQWADESGGGATENGFVDRDDSSLSFTDGTRTFTITPTGASFSFYQAETEYTISSADSIVIADTEGLHFIYYEGTTLKETTTFSPNLITLYALVAVVYWDATNNEAVYVGDERHGNVMDSATHSYNHLTFGARYGNGLGLGDMDVDGSGNDASAAQFSVANGEIWDEDIQVTITDDSPQNLATIAQIPLFYRSGANGDWRKIAATNFPITTTGTGLAAWNQDTGATWQLAEVGNNDFVLMHYYATPDIDNPVIGILGQNTYGTVGQARTGAEAELQGLSLGGLGDLTPEYVPIATVIWQTSNSYSNTVQSRVRSTDDGDDYIDWREQRGAGGGQGFSTVYADNIVSLPPGGDEYVTNIYWDPTGMAPVYVHSATPPTDRLTSNPPSGYQVIENIYWDVGAAGPAFVLGAVIP